MPNAKQIGGSISAVFCLNNPVAAMVSRRQHRVDAIGPRAALRKHFRCINALKHLRFSRLCSIDPFDITCDLIVY